MADLTKTIEVNAETGKADKQISDIIKKIEQPVKLEIDADIKEVFTTSVKEVLDISKSETYIKTNIILNGISKEIIMIIILTKQKQPTIRQINQLKLYRSKIVVYVN